MHESAIEGVGRRGSLRGADRDGMRFQGRELAAAAGRGRTWTGCRHYHVEIANVATLESNSPVLINDVVVGSVGKMTVKDWHADVEISVQPDVVVPGQRGGHASGRPACWVRCIWRSIRRWASSRSGRLPPGATIPLNESSTYPTTEQTLSSLSAVVNGGGLGQIGDIIHNFNAALSGRETEIRELLTRLDTFIGTLDAQRDNLVATIKRSTGWPGPSPSQRDVIDEALNDIPPALDVLIRERPEPDDGAEKARERSATPPPIWSTTRATTWSRTCRTSSRRSALADVGPDLNQALRTRRCSRTARGSSTRAAG